MDRWPKSSHRRGGRDNPSFSSSLLDAIYRSIDESDGGARAPNPPLILAGKKKQDAPPSRKSEHIILRCRPPVLTTTSSSSDGSSSYGGFSSDDSRAKPLRTAAPQEKARPDLPPLAPEKKKSSSSSIRSRFREMRKPRAGSAPASPGARLAGFLNSLFSNGSPKKRNINISPAVTGEDSACSSASSYTRSCLNKTPRSGGRKRTVRFGPVSVVDEHRHSGRRSVDGELVKARESRRVVEELLRELGAAVDDGGAESDSSSDLFELEINGGGRRYRDELPVYETTHFPTNRALSHGLVLY